MRNEELMKLRRGERLKAQNWCVVSGEWQYSKWTVVSSEWRGADVRGKGAVGSGEWSVASGQ